jgi:CheY-like chemotaxis protein
VYDTPSILVAGNERLYLDLSERLPKSCRVYFCETIGETLDRAVDATVLLLDQDIPGGGLELCRRLQADPMTAGIPRILLTSASHPDGALADRVAPPEIDGAIGALRQFIPDLAVNTAAPIANQRAQESVYFDLDERTVSWRPGSPTEAWPPPPPVLQPGSDILTHTQDLAGYINSLVEAYEHPDDLRSDQQARMDEVSRATLERMDDVLGQAQQEVNAALRAKDLTRMRELSAAKTALFERLQRLRTMLAQSSAPTSATPRETTGRAGVESTGPRPYQRDDAGPAAALEATAGAGGIDHLETTPMDGSLEAASAAHADRLGTTGPPPPEADPLKPIKSQLTLAAEQKAQQRKQASVRNRPAAATSTRRAPIRPAGGSARRSAAGGDASAGGFKRMGFVLLAMALAGIAWYTLSDHGTTEEQARPRENAPPSMSYVTIQQTPAGIIARPRAKDPEGDRVVYAVRWYVDDALVPDARTARLSPDAYSIGMVVQVEVTPTDSFGSGKPMRSQKLEIRDTPTHGAAARPRAAAPEGDEELGDGSDL